MSAGPDHSAAGKRRPETTLMHGLVLLSDEPCTATATCPAWVCLIRVIQVPWGPRGLPLTDTSLAFSRGKAMGSRFVLAGDSLYQVCINGLASIEQ